LTIADAAAGRTTLVALIVTLLLGSVLLVPSLWYMYALFQRSPAGVSGPHAPDLPGTIGAGGKSR